jgi:hypothetical protein
LLHETILGIQSAGVRACRSTISAYLVMWQLRIGD